MSKYHNLQVYLEDKDDMWLNDTTSLWRKRGESSHPVWRQASIEIADTVNNRRLVFESRRGLSFRSDIAIDDITVRSGTCKYPETCS